MLPAEVPEINWISSEQCRHWLKSAMGEYDFLLVTDSNSNFNPCPAEPGYTLPLQTV